MAVKTKRVGNRKVILVKPVGFPSKINVIKGQVKAKKFKSVKQANRFIKKLKREYRPYTVIPAKDGVVVEYV